jgi:hypothetical protein
MIMVLINTKLFDEISATTTMQEIKCLSGMLPKPDAASQMDLLRRQHNRRSDNKRTEAVSLPTSKRNAASPPAKRQETALA